MLFKYKTASDTIIDSAMTCADISNIITTKICVFLYPAAVSKVTHLINGLQSIDCLIQNSGTLSLLVISTVSYKTANSTTVPIYMPIPKH